MKSFKLQNKPLNNLFPVLIIIIAVFILYFQTITYKLVYLDDNFFILDLQGFISQFSNITKSFSEDVFRGNPAQRFYYRPVMTISLILDAQFGKISLAAYHFTNIIIHILTGIILFLLLRKFTGNKNKSLFFSILFLVHPVLTQSVAWIPGRNDSLLGLFLLCSIYSFIKYIETNRHKHFWYHIFWFTVSLFTKETAIILPVMCLGYLQFRTADNKSQKISLLNLILSWVILIGVFLLIRNSVLTNSGTQVSNIIQSIIKYYPMVLAYFGKIVLPVNLTVYPVLQDMPLVYGGISVIVFVGIYLLFKPRRYTQLIFGLMWFILFLLPSLVKLDDVVCPEFFEHRVYVPLIGIIISLSGLEYAKFKININKIVAGCGLIIIILFSGITFKYMQNFKDEMLFWNKAVTGAPHSAFAYNNLGAMHYLKGNYNQSVICWNKSVELNPQERIVHNNLGLVYMNRNQFNLSEQEFKKEIEINPYYGNAYYNYGLLKYRQKKIDEAISLWEKTVEFDRGHKDAYTNLILYYRSTKNINKLNYYIQQAQLNNVLIP